VRIGTDIGTVDDHWLSLRLAHLYDREGVGSLRKHTPRHDEVSRIQVSGCEIASISINQAHFPRWRQ
jgi:hypothetical protein